MSTFSLPNDLIDGISASFWFRPVINDDDSLSDIQTLFALQSSTSSTWSFAVEYISANNSINIRQLDTAFVLSATASVITPSN